MTGVQTCALPISGANWQVAKRNSLFNVVITSFTLRIFSERKVGEVILVAITPRTTIELPANLSQAEIAERVELYKKLHSSKI